LHAVRNLPGAKSVEGIGRDGLRTALSWLPNEPTLLIHDDVVITARGLSAMERQLAVSGGFVVPYTNDPHADHFVGALPIDKDAERSLDRLPVPKDSKPSVTTKPACLLANAADLNRISNEPLADPYAILDAGSFGITVAGGALAAHSAQCVKRLLEEDADGRPLLVAALIVKDEERMLPDCLESLAPVVDRIEVCDTGSTDRTIEIARAAGAHVIERDWPDDFGEARNYVLEECRDARYVLWIDADERLVCDNAAHIRKYLATYAADHVAFSLNITNLDSDGSEMYTFSTVRLFQADDTEFRGALHEAAHRIDELAPLQGQIFDQMSLLHHGYATEVVEDRDKTTRNLELAEAQHAADDDARSAIHLARSLSYAGEAPERALELLEQTWLEATETEPFVKAQILSLMADACASLGDDERALDLSRQALQFLPADDTAAAIFANAAERLGRLDELVDVAEEILDAYSARPLMKVDHNRYLFRGTLAVAYCEADQPERAVEEAFAVLDSATTNFEGWAPLVTCLHANYAEAAIQVVGPLAIKDSTGGFLEPLIRTVPSSTLADFCVLYNQLGGELTEVTRVGLLAAAISEHDAAFAALAPAASSLEPLVRVGLADRIASQGRQDLADQLRSEPVVLRL
jgi:tetratricopeptide (TPR) repeat protein